MRQTLARLASIILQTWKFSLALSNSSSFLSSFNSCSALSRFRWSRRFCFIVASYSSIQASILAAASVFFFCRSACSCFIFFSVSSCIRSFTSASLRSCLALCRSHSSHADNCPPVCSSVCNVEDAETADDDGWRGADFALKVAIKHRQNTHQTSLNELIAVTTNIRVATVLGKIIQGLFKKFPVPLPNLFQRCFTTSC